MTSASSWKKGDHLTHRFNPDLGIGVVRAVEARALLVEFQRAGTTLRLAADPAALVRVEFRPGRRVRVTDTREETTVAALLPDGTVQLANGRTVSSQGLWPLELDGSLLERLALGDLDDIQDFLIRLDILHLLTVREARGLGSFLGGRVRLFPHQLHVAERATAADPVRWLLADEVGLGKTIEASLILNRLVHTGRVERCLVVAPEALTVQWLGELWRKYHQVFTILDAPRLADVARDFGADFNPFDVHRRAVVALETLVERPQLTQQAVAAGIDLLVVDEAQRLRRPPGHPGEPAWRAIAPIAELGRHVLLLSATPLEDDAHGFFRLLQLLRPLELPEDVSFDERLAGGHPLPPCTSSTRRVDIGGLPPRVGIPIAIDDAAGWQAREAVERAVRSTGAPNAVVRRQKIDRIRRALASGAALGAALALPSGTRPVSTRRAATLGSDAVPAAYDAAPTSGFRVALGSAAPWAAPWAPTSSDTPTASPLASPVAAHASDTLGASDAQALRQQAAAMDERDPRVAWLVSQAPQWRDAQEKTLVFVAHRETLEMLRTALAHRAQVVTGVFHEDLAASRRDIEVARFREPEGPSLLVSTECGGEGRNFEFCRRLVLFDLPWKPSVVEQRIGRLDRIGRRIPVEIVYFVPPGGIGRDVVRLFEALGVFREPLAGLEPQLAHVEAALEEVALEPEAALSGAQFEVLVGQAHAARTRIREAAYQQLHRDPYRAEMADGILARVPSQLDALNEAVVVAAAERLGFHIEPQRGHRTYSIDIGNQALVDGLPGVPGGSSFLGSFDREEAVEDETRDFFASGHPLVEGIFSHFEDSSGGRVARFEIEIGQERGVGVAAFYKDGPDCDIVVFDSTGQPRSDWAAALGRRPLQVRPVTDPSNEGWQPLVRRLGALLDASRRPYALATIVVRPAR